MSTAVRERLHKAIERAGLVGRPLLVALSGGLDSVCLLRLLAPEAGGTAGALEVAHVDHGLRPDSRADADFCRRLAEELGLPFHLRTLVAGELRRGRGLQAEARRLRRAFLEETLWSRGLSAVALGHHADDQAETVLLRLIRGTGPRGVCGMAAWEAPYLRPLLEVRRAELEALAAESRWAHREDPTNRSPKYLRNRVRHEVLPLLRTLNPSVEGALGRFARLSAEDDAWLSDEAHRAVAAMGHAEPEGLRLAVAALRELPAALRRRVYLAAWSAVGGETEVLETCHLEAVDGLLADGRPQRRAAVPGPAGFARCWESLWVLSPDAGTTCVGAVALSGPGRIPLGVFAVDAVWGPPAEGVAAVRLPAGRPAGTLWLRTRRPGDRLAGRKVKDLLMESRLPSWRRARALVAEDGGGVLGVLAPGASWQLQESGAGLPNQAIWLEEGGEKRWCP